MSGLMRKDWTTGLGETLRAEIMAQSRIDPRPQNSAQMNRAFGSQVYGQAYLLTA